MEHEVVVVASLPDLRPMKEINKMEKMQFSAPPGSVCKRQFLVTVSVLDVKSLVEHDGEG